MFTLVEFHATVYIHVYLKCLATKKCFSTFFTLIALLPDVTSFMFLTGTEKCETSATLRTFVRLLCSMRTLVVPKTLVINEGLTALLTFVWLIAI